jgi:hypothetical protein
MRTGYEEDAVFKISPLISCEAVKKRDEKATWKK